VARNIQKIEPTAPRVPTLKRVATYARVSNGKDAMLHSLSAQVSFYSNMVQSHPGWQYMGVYAEGGHP
jgi:site-specific DNA recombinase